MDWWGVIKAVKYLPEDEALSQGFKSAEEKGYPSIVTPLTIVAEVDDEGNIWGYTSYKNMGKFSFVGNAFVKPEYRGKKFFSELVRNRNIRVSGRPAITLLNPLKGTSLGQLVSFVEKRGGTKVESYEQVADIMDEATYRAMAKLPMYRYPVM